MSERCPRCGCDKQLDVSEFLDGRDWGVLYYCGTIYWPSRDEVTAVGVACRQLTQAQEQLQQALAREAELRRVVEVARNLAVTLHRHNEQTVLRHRLGDDADLADDEGYCCEICCEVGDLLYDLGQALGEIGIDDLSKIPDLRDLAKLDKERPRVEIEITEAEEAEVG